MLERLKLRFKQQIRKCQIQINLQSACYKFIMDENHYNFIKRPLKIFCKPPQPKRSVLDKIQNFDKPIAARSRAATIQRSAQNSVAEVPSQSLFKETQFSMEAQILKPEFQMNLPMKHQNQKRRITRKSQTKSFISKRNSKIELSKSQVQEPIPRDICQKSVDEFGNCNDQQQKAVDNLCHLSLDETSLLPSDNFLSAWTNSYPIRDAYKKQTRKSQNITSRPVTSIYSTTRCISSRSQLARQISEMNKQLDTKCNNEQPSTNYFQLQIRRAQSSQQDQQHTKENHFKKIPYNEQKMIFFRNGIIKHLRKKQNLGRHTVNSEWGPLHKNLHDSFAQKSQDR